MTNGDLALPESAFKHLDFIIASVHTNLNLSQPQMTARILKALNYPKVKILGHPTGRLINKRIGYELDWDKIFAICKSKQIALEINASPFRLDLSEDLVKKAINSGVKLASNTDSHSLEHLDFMPYGVDVARRGWATKADIVNTYSWNKLSQWLGL